MDPETQRTAKGKSRGGCLPFDCTNFDFELQKSELCNFTADIFEEVMINLIRNPNILSSQVYRADIFYDSLNDPDGNDYLNSGKELPSLLQRALKPDIMPLKLDFGPGHGARHSTSISRTFVRQFIPRNPTVDKQLLQTCHLLESIADDDDTMSAVLIPHIDEKEEIPFYHPPVKAFCFHWSRVQSDSAKEGGETNGKSTDSPYQYRISIFAASLRKTPISTLPDRFHRILQNLIGTIIKHGHHNQLPGGYVKRVQHDVIIPRKRYQDSLVRLKLKYATALLSDWRESTDPRKHVFEDICIAAFLTELWADIYGAGVKTESQGFPGFVDIGCGNGLLVNILAQEGYEGCGFDIRRRKSWDAFSPEVQHKLHESIFVPAIYRKRSEQTAADEFIKPGNFIISNHADELTPWTPLIAYMYRCPFISIPCCSHDLGGQRCRFAPRPKTEVQSRTSFDGCTSADLPSTDENRSARPARAADRPASAYATLCDYVQYLAKGVGFAVEREILRIPSTRNTAILGVKGAALARCEDKISTETLQDRMDTVSTIVQSELKLGLAAAAEAWMDRAQSLMKGKPPSH